VLRVTNGLAICWMHSVIPNRRDDLKTPASVWDDVDAILRGIYRARVAPHVEYLYKTPICQQTSTCLN
jgi:hypothetical protein